MNTIIWYDCPKCGAPNSSDGEHFCGPCEEAYQKDAEAQGQFKTESEMLDFYANLNE